MVLLGERDIEGDWAAAARDRLATWGEEWDRRFETARERDEFGSAAYTFGMRLEWPLRPLTGTGSFVDQVRPPCVDAIAPWSDRSTDAVRGMVRMRFIRDADGRPAPAAFEVRPIGNAFTSRAVRSLGAGWLADGVDRVLQDPFVGRFVGKEWQRHVHRPGRGGRPDAFYAIWAQRYEKAVEVAPAKPIQYLLQQEQEQKRHATAAQVRAYLNRARERGLLGDAPKGGAGGALTAKAKRLLKTAGLEEDGHGHDPTT